MADVQLENGYVRIASDLLEALARIRIPGEARQVLDVIIRKTYGYKKREDRISLSQFCLATGIGKSHVCEALYKLNKINIITEKRNGIDKIYKINKDFDTWKPLPKKGILPKSGMVVTEKRNIALPKSGPTIDNVTIDNITIDKALPLNNGDVTVKDKNKSLYRNPDFVNPEIWSAYLEMRKSIHKPLKTQHQYNLAISTLEKLKSQGHNPNDILNQSILNSWQGLFAIKINKHTETDAERSERLLKSIGG